MKNKYDPYCKICSGCGDDGCCPASCCQQHEEGKYCKGYLKDLKFAYLMFKDTYEFLKDDEESKIKIDKIYDENWDQIYKNE